MLYEIHMLKNYPPTNLNRDDSGAPKSCQFGGTNRGRISSQCLKRSWRTSPLLAQAIGAEHLGTRTRWRKNWKRWESPRSIFKSCYQNSAVLATKTAKRTKSEIIPPRSSSMRRRIFRRLRMS